LRGELAAADATFADRTRGERVAAGE
jgi:hypothetical protein